RLDRVELLPGLPGRGARGADDDRRPQSLDGAPGLQQSWSVAKGKGEEDAEVVDSVLALVVVGRIGRAGTCRIGEPQTADASEDPRAQAVSADVDGERSGDRVEGVEVAVSLRVCRARRALFSARLSSRRGLRARTAGRSPTRYGESKNCRCEQ